MNLLEINQKFPTELDCIIYAEKIRFGKENKIENFKKYITDGEEINKNTLF